MSSDKAGRRLRRAWRSVGGFLSILAVSACDGESVGSTPVEQAEPTGEADSGMAADGEVDPSTSHADAGVTVDARIDDASDVSWTSPAHDGGASPALFLRFPDPVANLRHGSDQLAQFCAKGHDDLVSDAFCTGARPPISGLLDLLALLKVNSSATVGSEGFALIGNSTSLSKRSVSAINPRVIFLHLESPSEPLLAVAFTRGEPLVEIVARDRTRKDLQFYLVSFELPCNRREEGCTPGELLTSSIERDWQNVDAYDEEDVENTTMDCRVCHQPSGPTTPKLLRMQEAANPWTHWFDDQTRGGRALYEDYNAAHGDEALAGIPGSIVSMARGGLVAAFASTAGTDQQPNEFRSDLIEAEVERSAPGQPADNTTPGQSATWQALYQASLRMEAIPVPYHDAKITDPIKLRRMQQAYADYLSGKLPLWALPDIRDVAPDDPVLLAEMSFALDERLDDAALLTAACGLCHNRRLDQNLSRARFHTDLEQLSPEEKETAIERLSLAGDDVLAMPPRRIYALSDTARARLIELLRH